MHNNTEKKILFVATQFPPNESIGTQRIVKFIKYLRRRGWEIYVLTLWEKYYGNSNNSYQFYLPDGIHVYRRKKIDIFKSWESFKKRILKNHGTKLSKYESENIFIPNQEQGKNKLLGSTFLYYIKETITNLMQYPDKENGFFFSVFFSALKIINTHNIPHVFISSPPHSTVIPLTLLRMLKKFVYIVDFRDPWARSQWQESPRHIYQKITKILDLFFEKMTLKNADLALFNTQQLKNDFDNYYEGSSLQLKFNFISNGFDPELREKYSRNLLEKTRINNSITILHAGTLYKKRNPQKIFEGLIKFRDIYPEKAKLIHLKFLGTLSSDLSYLEQFVKDYDLSDQIIFMPKLSYKKTLSEMGKADWLLLLQPGTTFQIPAKFFDYILFKLPIWGVLEENSVGENTINKLNTGYISYCHSVDSIIEFFKYITNDEVKYFNINETELEEFSVPHLVDRFESILENHSTRIGNS